MALPQQYRPCGGIPPAPWLQETHHSQGLWEKFTWTSRASFSETQTSNVPTTPCPTRAQGNSLLDPLTSPSYQHTLSSYQRLLQSSTWAAQSFQERSRTSERTSERLQAAHQRLQQALNLASSPSPVGYSSRLPSTCGSEQTRKILCPPQPNPSCNVKVLPESTWAEQPAYLKTPISKPAAETRPMILHETLPAGSQNVTLLYAKRLPLSPAMSPTSKPLQQTPPMQYNAPITTPDQAHPTYRWPNSQDSQRSLTAEAGRTMPTTVPRKYKLQDKVSLDDRDTPSNYRNIPTKRISIQTFNKYIFVLLDTNHVKVRPHSFQGSFTVLLIDILCVGPGGLSEERL